MFVLQNSKNQYLNEFLMGQVIFCNSIQKAMIFENDFNAITFKKRIFIQTGIDLSVQTLIK